MLPSIFKLIIRGFQRNLSYSIISMSSLVVGITTAIILFVWVTYEFGFDGSMPDRERVYALLTNDLVEGNVETMEGNNAPLMDFLQHDVPEIETVTRIDNSRKVLSIGEKGVQKAGVYGDSSFFDVHPSPLLSGNAKAPLPDNHSIALSSKLADLLFEANDALGKTVIIDRKDEFIVTAVYASFPDNSSFDYIEFVLPYHSKKREAGEWVNYDLKLFNPTSRGQVEQKINKKFAELFNNENSKALLFPLEDWRLHWNFENGEASGGRIRYIIIFCITGAFVLMMAAINYMNMATARATKRTKEVGVRKMTGATQRVLIWQFMTENLILTSIASLISLFLAYALMPFFGQLVHVNLTISFSDIALWMGLGVISMITALLAGSYPALLLSSFKPVAVLKGSLHLGLGGAGLRKALVVFQFALSAIIILCSLVMWQQTDYLLKKDLGYDKHRIINIWLDGDEGYSRDNLRSSIIAHASVEAAALSGASPMEVNGYAECDRVASPLADPLLFYGANIDEHVLSTLRFEIAEGRNFTSAIASDSSNFIITRKAADLLGLKHPIGERISFNMFGPQEGEIVGVIEDFQNDDIHMAEKPVVFVFGKEQYFGNLFVRYQESKLAEAAEHIKATFEKFQPGIPVNYSFLDGDFEDQLFREKQLSNMSVWFTVIAIVIACLGLFGLVMFTAQRRIKEIGIRKVLGASVRQIAMMLCRDFIMPVIYSFMFAFPIAYYVMEKFLEEYPSRVTLSFYSFGAVGVGMMVMVLVTISYQSLKAATQNPTESLKME